MKCKECKQEMNMEVHDNLLCSDEYHKDLDTCCACYTGTTNMKKENKYYLMRDNEVIAKNTIGLKVIVEFWSIHNLWRSWSNKTG